jgi:hypothetical protein
MTGETGYPPDEIVARIESLERRVAEQAERISALERKLPNTSILSSSFLTRAFAVWGHVFVAGLIIAAVFYCVAFLIAMILGG